MSGLEPRQKQEHRKAGVSMAMLGAGFLLSRAGRAGSEASPPPRAAKGVSNPLFSPPHFFRSPAYFFVPDSNGSPEDLPCP